ALLPRPRRAGAGAGLGPDAARRCSGVRRERAVGGDLPRRRHLARRVRLQPVRRRAARLPRPQVAGVRLSCRNFASAKYPAPRTTISVPLDTGYFASRNSGMTSTLLAAARLHHAVALEGDLGAGVSLLQLHAPVAQIGQHDRLAGDGTAHEVAWRDHLELAVEEAQPCLALEAEQLFKPVHCASTATLVAACRRCASVAAALRASCDASI